MEKINLSEKFSLIDDYWNPKIISELNGQQIKLVKFAGEFVWHKHENEDEAFLVFQGTFRMELRDKAITLQPGEMIVIPRGTDHKPVAEQEVWVLLFEPAGTLNTGNIIDEKTKTVLDKI